MKKVNDPGPVRPTKWSHATRKELSPIRGICLDIDDTLTSDGKLTSKAFTALWKLKKAGFVVVPITGRPAGWCDHFARFWPVDAVVGENGAFTFYMEDGIRRRLDTPGAPKGRKEKLERLSKKILEKFPDARWASDQPYREFDLAIDVREDVEPWPAPRVDALLALCESEGAKAKLSSIHVNAWFGEYDKRAGLVAWLAQGAPGLSTSAPSFDELLFIGDSPNDEPMFSSFRYSVGVANLTQYLDRLKHPPRWITRSESGKGFAEMARRMVEVSQEFHLNHK